MGKNNQNNGNSFFAGVLIGSAIGAVTALLVTPKSGKEVRQGLSGQTDVVKEKGNQYANIALEKSTNLAKQLSDQSSQVADKVKEMSGNVKGKVANAEADVDPDIETDAEDGTEKE